MENMTNPSNTEEIVVPGKLTRYTINVKTRKIRSKYFTNKIGSEHGKYVNHIDFPTINEAFRGQKVSFLYNVSTFRMIQ